MPSFRVRSNDKTSAMWHGMDGRPSAWRKARRGVQEALVEAAPARCFMPPYVGHHGWVGCWLDGALYWDEIADSIEESYRMTAPKRLVTLLDTR